MKDREYQHLYTTIARRYLDESGQLKPGSQLVVDLGKATFPLRIVVAVQCSAPVLFSVLGTRTLRKGRPMQKLPVRVRMTKPLPLADVDVYGFPSFRSYVQWRLVIPYGNPPKTAGDGENVAPTPVDE